MLSQSSIRLWLICLTLVVFNDPAWSQSRHIDVKAVDEHERPLVDATVMITMLPEPPEFVGDEEHLDDEKALKRVFARTGASGSAKVDVSTLDAIAPNLPLRVIVSKNGYGLQAVTAQTQARIRCLPVLKRRFQILDAEGQPVAGLKIQHHLGVRVAAVDEAKLAWWTDTDARTNEFGVVTLDGHAIGSGWFEMINADGTRHQVRQRYGFSNGITVDLRDLVVVRLSRFGKIEGQLPAEFAQDYAVRLIPQLSLSWAPSDNTTGGHTRIELQPDGKFAADVAEGIYWFVVGPKSSSDSAQRMKAGKAPQSQQQIQVVAGQTCSVSVNTITLAKVSGRLVSKTSEADFSNAQISISHELPSEPPYPTQRPSFGRVPCLADGTFECWLPPGRYELGCVSKSLWSAHKPLSLDVGAGAAGLSAGQLLVSPTLPAKVVWQSEYRSPNYLQNHADYRLFFSFKDMPNIHCNLTHDGYGQIFAPVGAEPPGIHQNISNTINPRPNSISAFADIDPSENYQLELITKGQGFGNNIGLRGRVVDTLGNGIANVPVSLALDHKVETSSGMQVLELVKTEADGSFQIPPRQFLSHLRLSSPEAAIKGTFTFSAFILANPEPVEVQKIISLKSQAWELNEIEFPDLVVEPPLVNKRLSVHLQNASGQPAEGEFIQLADQRRLIGAIADAHGRVEIEHMTGPTGILRSSDWSIHAIDNYDQPLTIPFESNAHDRSSVAVKGRLSKEQRQALARQVLQAVPKLLTTPALPIAEPFQPLSDEAYLSPDESFQQVLLLAGPEGDVQRMQFANFWNGLSHDRLQQLVAAMGTDMAKMELLRIVADRQPSAEAYSRVMDAVPLTNQYSRSFFLSGDPEFKQIAEVGLKLHHLGKLDLHREKIRQFIEHKEAVRARTQVVRRSKPYISQQERNYGLMCRALIDPEQFARETLQLLSMEDSQLSPEDRDKRFSHARLFVQLYPQDHHKLPMTYLRVARGDEMMMSFGEQAPLNALDAYKQGHIAVGQLRQVAESAMLSQHPDSGSMVQQANILLVRSETPRERILDTHNEIHVYQAARRVSPALARQQAWLMARDYLSGRYEVNKMNIMPTQDQLANRALAVAYCLTDEYPQLAQQIARLGVPRVMNNLERKFEQRNWDAMDITLAAWFEPQATCELLIKLNKRYADELQKQNAQPVPGQLGAVDSTLQYMANDIASLRHACLRGLLLDEL